ncbi:hypothetical protein LINPERHAP1_LOCUS34702 [Linum perenne]
MIKNVRHALNAERPKQLYKHIKSFMGAQATEQVSI